MYQKRSIDLNMFYGAHKNTFLKAKELRKNLTPGEKALWDCLKNVKAELRFKRQHPINNFIADFYCHKAKLVIEVDGEIHNHQQEYDLSRTAEMEKFGIRVLRFSNTEVLNDIDGVIEIIKTTLDEVS
ncbi:MAG: endonuclease domain-containing protein [Bacteroidales bacterium]|nr:endonuclease domain-containing protein [Bacteroidales bacterium]